MKPPAGKLPPADPRYQAYWKDILWRKYEHKGFDKLKKMVSQEENRFTVSGGRHIIRRLEELLNEVVQDFEYLGRIISQNDVEEVLARRELLCPQEFDLQSELRVINQEPMAWFEQICRPRTRRDRLVPLVYSPSAVLTKNELRTELTDAEFFALVETM